MVVPSRNAERTIVRCLSSLLESQYDGGLTIVVVDDGSTDGTARLVKALACADARLCYLWLDPAGVNAARNRGVEAGEGELVAFVDSDEWVDPDHLARCAAQLVAAPELDGVGGPYLDEGADGLRRCASCRRGLIRLQVDETGSTTDLFGGNMVLRRRVLDEVGLFDPAISGFGDDTEWFRRAKGHQFRYDPALGIHHEFHHVRLGTLLRKRFRQGRTLSAFRARTGAPNPAVLHELVDGLGHALRYRCTSPLERLAALAGDLSARPGASRRDRR